MPFGAVGFTVTAKRLLFCITLIVPPPLTKDLNTRGETKILVKSETTISVLAKIRLPRILVKNESVRAPLRNRVLQCPMPSVHRLTDSEDATFRSCSTSSSSMAHTPLFIDENFAIFCGDVRSKFIISTTKAVFWTKLLIFADNAAPVESIIDSLVAGEARLILESAPSMSRGIGVEGSAVFY